MMKNPLFKFLGPLLAITGVLGLTGSSILWNFQGRSLGIPATVISLLILALGVVLLGPLQPPAAEEGSVLIETGSADHNQSKKSAQADLTQKLEKQAIENHENVEISSEAEDQESSKKSSLTTAEAIAAQLAAAEAEKPEIVFVNYAPGALQPGNAIRSNKRTPGQSLSGFKEMASDLFKTN